MEKIVRMSTGKEYKCKIIGSERVAHNGETIVPIQLEDGRRGLVPLSNIIEEVNKLDLNTKALEKLLSSNNIDYVVDYFSDCNQIMIEGWNHNIYVVIGEDGFALSTLHIENSKHYKDYEDEYKNQVSRKRASSTLTYINKYL